MLKKVLIGIVAAVVLFVGFVLIQPSSYTVARNITIEAPPAAVYAQVSDFKKWIEWSPWEELDPDMKKTFTGNAGEVGSTYAWDSVKDDVGAGEMIVTAVKADQSIDFDLNFIRPFVSKNKTGFKLEPKGAATDVTWTMVGPKNFMLKAMMLFMDIEGMVAKDFDKGLAKLKTKAEATAVPAVPAPAPAAAATPAKES